MAFDFNCCFAGCLARNLLDAKRQIAAAVSVEKYARRWFCRCEYLHLRSSALVIQSGVRYMLAIQKLLQLKNNKAATIIQVSMIFEPVEPDESKYTHLLKTYFCFSCTLTYSKPISVSLARTEISFTIN